MHKFSSIYDMHVTWWVRLKWMKTYFIAYLDGRLWHYLLSFMRCDLVNRAYIGVHFAVSKMIFLIWFNFQLKKQSITFPAQEKLNSDDNLRIFWWSTVFLKKPAFGQFVSGLIRNRDFGFKQAFLMLLFMV